MRRKKRLFLLLHPSHRESLQHFFLLLPPPHRHLAQSLVIILTHSWWKDKKTKASVTNVSCHQMGPSEWCKCRDGASWGRKRKRRRRMKMRRRMHESCDTASWCGCWCGCGCGCGCGCVIQLPVAGRKKWKQPQNSCCCNSSCNSCQVLKY